MDSVHPTSKGRAALWAAGIAVVITSFSLVSLSRRQGDIQMGQGSDPIAGLALAKNTVNGPDIVVRDDLGNWDTVVAASVLASAPERPSGSTISSIGIAPSEGYELIGLELEFSFSDGEGVSSAYIYEASSQDLTYLGEAIRPVAWFDDGDRLLVSQAYPKALGIYEFSTETLSDLDLPSDYPVIGPNSLSADNEKLLFSDFQEGEMIFDLLDESTDTLTEQPSDQNTSHLHWSPDDSLIAVIRTMGDAGIGILSLFDPSGVFSTTLTPSGAMDHELRWSRGGSDLVVLRSARPSWVNDSTDSNPDNGLTWPRALVEYDLDNGGSTTWLEANVWRTGLVVPNDGHHSCFLQVVSSLPGGYRAYCVDMNGTPPLQVGSPLIDSPTIGVGWAVYP